MRQSHLKTFLIDLAGLLAESRAAQGQRQHQTHSDCTKETHTLSHVSHGGVLIGETWRAVMAAVNLCEVMIELVINESGAGP